MTVSAPPNRINNVQALRGFAALLVVLGHTEYSLPGLLPFGTFGVDIFFVISGYIMAMIVARNPEKFFLRRLIRILPLYWAATLGVFCLAAWKPGLMMHTRANFRELALSLLFIPFFKNGLVDHANPILFVGWTLNYEMFFYLLLALALTVSRRLATVLAATLLVIVVLVCRPFGARHAATLVYGDGIMLEFLLGMIAYSLEALLPATRARQLRWAAVAFLVAAAVFMIGSQGATFFWKLLPGPQWWPIWPVPREYLSGIPALVLVLSAGVLSKGGWDTRSKLLVLLGDASYVIYIVHTYVLDGFERILARIVPALSISHGPGCLLSISLVCGLSVVIYLKAEKPAVDWLSARFGTKRIPRQEVADPAESMA
jgi:peptidoglycan/LPS O-acetylase OafA/YrhL